MYTFTWKFWVRIIFVQYVPVKKNTLWKMNVSQWTKLHLAFCQFIYKWINSLLTVQNIHIKYDFHYLSEALFFCLTVYIHDLHVFEEKHVCRAFFYFHCFSFSFLRFLLLFVPCCCDIFFFCFWFTRGKIKLFHMPANLFLKRNIWRKQT